MSDRIKKLAEAMGWVNSIGPRGFESHGKGWYSPTCDWSVELSFDPFTDANDDYAVLEWMRVKYEPDEIELAFDHIGYGHRWAYDVGTYAAAALALMGGEIVRCSDCVALKGDDDD